MDSGRTPTESMPLEPKLHIRLSQRLVMTPTLQQAIKLLQMSKLELSEVMNRELVQNPALEEEEESEETEASDSGGAERAETPIGSSTTETVAETPAKLEEAWGDHDIDSFFQDEWTDPGWRRENLEDREEFSFEATLTRPTDLAGHLEWQLGMTHESPAVRDAAHFVIGNIDDDGFLTVSKEEIESAGPWSPVEAARALTLVRSFDPPGVAAFDLRDCLLLQLDQLGVDEPLVRRVVQDHWVLFLNRKFTELASELGVDFADLEAVVEVVRNLEPKPGRAYSTERTIYVEPDVFVAKIDGEYVISLNDDGMPRLRISERYRRMLRGGTKADAETANYIRDKIRSAVWLIKSLDQRQRTIYKVAESIIRHQNEFFDRGIDALRPLVLRDVAQDIGMHESTVSRVVSNKYMHTPRGLFPMKYFFHSGIETKGGEGVSSLSVKQKIKALIDGEDSHRPLADAKLMQILNREGIQIARRTVAKYREELGIPSSTDRKKVF